MNIAVFLLCLLVTASSAMAATCTQDEETAAETAVDHLHDWESLHAAYARFSQCDDGAVAEGFSEAAAKLMANGWEHIGEGAALAKASPEFGTWAITHLDQTDDSRDLARIDHLAQTSCPDSARDFCRQLHRHLRKPGYHSR